MAERGQCLKCASGTAEPGFCSDCGQIRRGQFAARDLVRGPDSWHYIKLVLSGLVALDVALYLCSKFIYPMNVVEPPITASVEGSPPSSAPAASYQTMEGYRSSVVSILAQSIYWDENYDGGSVTISVDQSGRISVPEVRNCRLGGQIRFYAKRCTLPPPPHQHVRMQIPLNDLRAQCPGDITEYRKIIESAIKNSGIKQEWLGTKLLVTIGRNGAYLGCESARHRQVLAGDLVYHLQQLTYPSIPSWWTEETITLELDFSKHGSKNFGNWF